MAAKKYIKQNTDGSLGEESAIQTSAGAGDGGKIPALADATGKLDASFMPSGIGANTRVALAFEALAAGDFVNVFLSSSVLKVRKADASAATKFATGFVLAAVSSGANATVYPTGETNSQLSGLTIGEKYVLSSSTPGAVVLASSRPTAAATITQFLGVAASATELDTNIQHPPVTNA